MKIKKVKYGHIANCSYCKKEGNLVPVVWHLTGANKQSCESHKYYLEHLQEQHKQVNSRDYTEADYQTWLRL